MLSVAWGKKLWFHPPLATDQSRLLFIMKEKVMINKIPVLQYLLRKYLKKSSQVKANLTLVKVPFTIDAVVRKIL